MDTKHKIYLTQQNEGDLIHTTIEREVKRELRKGPIYLPSHYLVHKLSPKDFFCIKAQKSSQVILPMLDIRIKENCSGASLFQGT